MSLSKVARVVGVAVEEARRPDPEPAAQAAPEAAGPSAAALLRSHVWANYRLQILPWAVGAVLVLTSTQLRAHHIPVALVALLTLPTAPVVTYWTALWALRDRAVNDGRIDEAQTTGKHVARINRRARQVAIVAALAAAALVATVACDPGTWAGVAAWSASAIAGGLCAYRCVWRDTPDVPAVPMPEAVRPAPALVVPNLAGAAPSEDDEIFGRPAPRVSPRPPARPAGPAPTTPPAAPGHPARTPLAPPARPETTAAARPAPRPAVPATPAVEYHLPPVALLSLGQRPRERTTANNEALSRLQAKLEELDLPATARQYRRGPTVSTYEIEVHSGSSVKPILTRVDDLALALGTENFRVLKPIPGKQLLGVEVPNADRDYVTLGAVLRSRAALNDTHPLTVGLGRDTTGNYVLGNLSKWVHILVAGATGGGKSGLINSAICSILVRATPNDVRFLMIDPKQVELSFYEGIPHLIAPIITNPKRAAAAMGWVVDEMEMRYDLLTETGVKNIDGYNQVMDERGQQRLPYLIVIVDELSNLIATAEDEVESAFERLGEKARGAGIHMLVATQRPSADIIKSKISANLPSRLAFVTTNMPNSRVILDRPGAEKLVGKGDGLYLPYGATDMTRTQCAWVDEAEIKEVVNYWKTQPAVPYRTPVTFATPTTPASEGTGSQAGGLVVPTIGGTTPADGGRPVLRVLSGGADPEPAADVDPDLLAQAAELVVGSQFGSTSMLQRKLRIGFAAAGRVMDALEDRGVVGPAEGSRARAVLIKPDELRAALEQLRAGADPAPASTAPSGDGRARPAHDVVLAAVRRLTARSTDGAVARDDIVAATPELLIATRNAAFTRLVDGGGLVREKNGRYRLAVSDPDTG